MNSITKLFTKPQASQLAQQELEDAKIDLLAAERMRDYYIKLAEFYRLRIDTLTTQTNQAKETI